METSHLIQLRFLLNKGSPCFATPAIKERRRKRQFHPSALSAGSRKGQTLMHRTRYPSAMSMRFQDDSTGGAWMTAGHTLAHQNIPKRKMEPQPGYGPRAPAEVQIIFDCWPRWLPFHGLETTRSNASSQASSIPSLAD